MSNELLNGRYNLSGNIIGQTERVKSGVAKPATGKPTESGESFKDILSREVGKTAGEVSFSKHADLRAKERNIAISSGDMGKLSDACERASQKGIKEALVVMNDSAFIVNAKNRVVVTVVDKNELKENVFSNIEGAVFL